MLVKTIKTNYTQKGVSFMGNGQLCDENGEIIDLMKELYACFPDCEFDISVSCTEKHNVDVPGLENREDIL